MMYFITACKHSPLSWEFQFCFAKSLRMVVEQGISWKPDRVPHIFQYCILFPSLPGRFIVLQKCSLASQVFSLCCNQEVSYTHLNKSLLDSYQSKSGKANICSSDAVSASALLWIHQWAVKYFSNIQPIGWSGKSMHGNHSACMARVDQVAARQHKEKPSPPGQHYPSAFQKLLLNMYFQF